MCNQWVVKKIVVARVCVAKADVARLVHLAYPMAPQDFMEQLAVQIFIYDVRDWNTESLTISIQGTRQSETN